MKILENKFLQFLVFTLGIILMIVVIGWFVASIEQKTTTGQQNNTITVSGTGEVYAVPDVGLIDISVLTENADLTVASDSNSKTMNAIIDYLKSEGVAEKDIKTTGYNIYPRYEYAIRTGKRILAGYDVSQVVNVKIRDLTKVGKIISQATTLGATDISSLSFIIDDDAQVKEQAKVLAINDAKDKAQKLEKELGIKLVRIVNFSESGSSPIYYGVGAGESMKMDSSAIAPTISTGQNKVTSNVSITYSIR